MSQGRANYAGRQGPAPWTGGRARWVAAVVLGTAFLLWLVLFAPRLLVPPASLRDVTDAAKRHELQDSRLNLQNDVRTTLLQSVGGLAVLLGAFFTYWQLQTSRRQLEHTIESSRQQRELDRQGQVTERFTRAIDQLGHAQLDVRLGGIYALERIARDSLADRATIGEVLTAFVRSHAPWPPRLPGQYVATALIHQVPELQVRTADVHACLLVLGRGGFARPESRSDRLDLYAVDLRHANLSGAYLEEAYLYGAHLEGADLNDAHLERANLFDAHLEGATLNGAHLEDAYLEGVHLEEAYLERAHLTRAMLADAHLEVADLVEAHLKAFLVEAHLEGAKLSGAHLEEANLLGAHLERADLREAHLEQTNLRGAHLEEAHLEGANLERANLDHARLGGTELRGARLDRANLTHADLAGAALFDAHLEKSLLFAANLERAVLIRAHLVEASLERSNLKEARLDRANLQRANLRHARLVGANFWAAELDGANLRGAHLEEAVNLRHADMAGAVADKHTTWPAFDWRAAGVILAGEDTEANPP